MESTPPLSEGIKVMPFINGKKSGADGGWESQHAGS
jgi:hypothetical protein